MPLLAIKTNIALAKDQSEALLPLLSRATADLLGKSERYVMATIEASSSLSFAGTTEPAAYVELKSIDLPQDQTKRYSATLCHLVEQQLGIPPERIYVEFSNAARALWGWNGTTFER